MSANKVNWQLWLGVAALGGFVITVLKYLDDKKYRKDEKETKKIERELKANQLALAKHELVTKTGKNLKQEKSSSFMDELFT